MIVNNLICETLDPKNGIVKLYRDLSRLNEEQKKQLIEEYNNYAVKNNIFTTKNKKLIK
jgi:hypothetical protein